MHSRGSLNVTVKPGGCFHTAAASSSSATGVASAAFCPAPACLLRFAVGTCSNEIRRDGLAKRTAGMAPFTKCLS